MAETEHHPSTPAAADDSAELPFEERRKQQRRQADRQGKYDRRRNRCLHCQFFQAEAAYCAYLEKPMAADEFACPAFEPAPPGR